MNIASKHMALFASLAAICCGIWAIPPAHAQGATAGFEAYLPDQNGINWFDPNPGNVPMEISIGSPSFKYIENFNLLRNYNWVYTIVLNEPDLDYPVYQLTTVSYGLESETFESPGFSSWSGPYTPAKQNGATLVWDGVDTFTFTARDGTVVEYKKYEQEIAPFGGKPAALGTLITRPDGEKITLRYQHVPVNGPSWVLYHSRPQSVQSTRGYQIRFTYQSDTLDLSDYENYSYQPWYRRTKVAILNDAIDYCDPNAISCGTLANSWPEINIASSGDFIGLGYYDGNGSGIMSATDSTGVTKSFEWSGTGPLESLSFAAKAGSPVLETILYPGLYGVTNSLGTWNYSPYLPPYFIPPYGTDKREEWHTKKRTDPNGKEVFMAAKVGRGQVLHITDELGRKTTYLYDSGQRLQYVVPPEGTITSGTPTAGYTSYDYDVRGNVVKVTQVAKAGSSLPDIFTEAGFPGAVPEVCPTVPAPTAKTINKPCWTKDANGNQTDYTYDPAHGGVLTEMKPLVTIGAPGSTVTARPLTVTTWMQRNAWVQNGLGQLIPWPDSIWVISTVTECQTSASNPNNPVCDGAKPQTLTTYEYGASGTNKALLVKGVSVSSGGTTLRTCYGYDIYHRKISETKPNADLGPCQ